MLKIVLFPIVRVDHLTIAFLNVILQFALALIHGEKIQPLFWESLSRVRYRRLIIAAVNLFVMNRSIFHFLIILYALAPRWVIQLNSLNPRIFCCPVQKYIFSKDPGDELLFAWLFCPGLAAQFSLCRLRKYVCGFLALEWTPFRLWALYVQNRIVLPFSWRFLTLKAWYLTCIQHVCFFAPTCRSEAVLKRVIVTGRFLFKCSEWSPSFLAKGQLQSF